MRLSEERIAEYRKLSKDRDGIFGYGCIEDWLEHHAALEAEIADKPEIFARAMHLQKVNDALVARNAKLVEALKSLTTNPLFLTKEGEPTWIIEVLRTVVNKVLAADGDKG